MRTFTSAQIAAMQGYPEIKISIGTADVGGSFAQGIYYISRFESSASYGYYEPGLSLDDWEIEIDYIGGIASTGDMMVSVNNGTNTISQLQTIESNSQYLEYSAIETKIHVDDNVYVLNTGIVDNWEIDNDEWRINIVDGTERYDIEILIEITPVNYPDAYDESYGLFLPILYSPQQVVGGQYSDIVWPGINVEKGRFQIVFANHAITQLASSDILLSYYEESISFYAHLVDVNGQVDTRTAPANTIFYDATNQITSYQKLLIGSRCDASYVSSFGNLIDSSGATTIVMTASTILSFGIDIGDLGFFLANNDLDVIVTYTGASGTIQMAHYALDDTTAYDLKTVSGSPYTYNTSPKASGNRWVFSDIPNYEFEILCNAGSAITISEVSVDIKYRKFSKTPRRRRIRR